MPAFEPFKFQQLPDGRIRPAQAPPASEIYGSKPKFDLPGMFANLFGGGDQQQVATSQGALPSNNQPAVAQGGSPGNQSAAAPALAGAQQPPASPLFMPQEDKPFWMGGTDVAGPYGGLGPAGQPQQAAKPPPKPQAGPEMVKQEVDRAKQGAKAAPEKAKQMADALEGTGVDLVEAYNDLFDQLGGVEKPETELTKEEKGLFIMSFGLRMMAASETMSAGGAFGAAGVPTVQEMQGLKQGREATAREVTENRRQRALDVLSERVRQREGALDRAAKPPATYDSATGLRTWNPQTGQWEQSLAPETDQPIQPGVTPGGHLRPSVFQQKLEALTRAGVPYAIAVDQAANNAPSLAEARLRLQEIYTRDRNLPLPDGTKWKNATEQQRREALDSMAQWMYGPAPNQPGVPGGGGQAAPPPGAAQQPAPQPAPQPGGGAVTVTSKAERDALPPGTVYVGPDGKPRIKK